MKDFNENRGSIKEAALDLSLCFLREMKQDEAADTLEGKRPTVSQIVTYSRAVQLIEFDSHAHLISKASSVIGSKSPSPVFKRSGS